MSAGRSRDRTCQAIESRLLGGGVAVYWPTLRGPGRNGSATNCLRDLRIRKGARVALFKSLRSHHKSVYLGLRALLRWENKPGSPDRGLLLFRFSNHELRLHGEVTRRVPKETRAFRYLLQNHATWRNSRFRAYVRGNDRPCANPTVRSNGNAPERAPLVGQNTGCVPRMLLDAAQNLHPTAKQRALSNVHI